MMRHISFSRLILLILCAHLSTSKPHISSSVISVYPETEDHIKHVLHMTDEYNLDIWKASTGSGEPFDILISPNTQRAVFENLMKYGIKYSVKIQDVISLINKVQMMNEEKRHSDVDWYESYHNYTEIGARLEDLSAQCGPGKCEIHNIGESTEGVELKVIKIGIPDETQKEKKVIWVDAGIHAREWIAHHTAMYFIERLITDKDDPEVHAMLKTFDWYILPVMNPDGYIFTWTPPEENRLWRKTRQVYENATCIGADANRNFDYKWMTIGASQDPCTNIFAGWAPYSEPEAAAVKDFILAMKPRVQMFLTLHSYSQLWMTAWGYTKQLPDNYRDLYHTALHAEEALEDMYDTDFTVGSASQILGYMTSGTSRDWAQSLGIPYVYTVELRDDGEYGFLLPPEQIRPTVEETWAGLKALLNKGIIPKTNQ